MSDKTDDQELNTEALKRLTAPFPDIEISLRPKPTKAQTEEVKRDFQKGIRCNLCGGWHHPNVVHLQYVGHAATTKRLLDVDIAWNWEFLHVDEKGFPEFDINGGLWITLTVLGVTRKGYGDAEGKTGPNAVKEVIGDAIRNASMRFGVALELWHKGEFKKDDDTASDQAEQAEQQGDFYPDDKFNDMLPSWKHAVESGTKTTNDILQYLKNKEVNLSKDQISKINNIGK